MEIHIYGGWELSGKYLILASRNIIVNNRHETILQVATDSKA